MTAAIAAVLSAAACGCPVTGGPTAPIVSLTATLAPGEFRYLDAETPSSTTQIDLQFNVDSVTAPLRLRQVDPACTPFAADSCAALTDRTLTERPAGVTSFGSNLQVTGARTRVVLQNTSAHETITVRLSIQPRQAGCT